MMIMRRALVERHLIKHRIKIVEHNNYMIDPQGVRKALLNRENEKRHK
jgi:hypothetical protein